MSLFLSFFRCRYLKINLVIIFITSTLIFHLIQLRDIIAVFIAHLLCAFCFILYMYRCNNFHNALKIAYIIHLIGNFVLFLPLKCTQFHIMLAHKCAKRRENLHSSLIHRLRKEQQKREREEFVPAVRWSYEMH